LWLHASECLAVTKVLQRLSSCACWSWGLTCKYFARQLLQADAVHARQAAAPDAQRDKRSDRVQVCVPDARGPYRCSIVLGKSTSSASSDGTRPAAALGPDAQCSCQGEARQPHVPPPPPPHPRLILMLLARERRVSPGDLIFSSSFSFFSSSSRRAAAPDTQCSWQGGAREPRRSNL
jgi:hypothetical protein